MKKQLIFILTLLLTGCGVGNYSTTGGVADQAQLSVTATQRKMHVKVIVDDKTYMLDAVYRIDFKTWKDIKATAANTIILTPGKHHVIVFRTVGDTDTPLLVKDIVLSVGEHRMLDL